MSAWRDEDKEGRRYRDYFPNASSYAITNYAKGFSSFEDATEITDFIVDLEAPLPGDLVQRFDVVFNHTTLEHVFDVHGAFTNLCRMSRDAVIIVVPFAQEFHGHTTYGDYWRLTPSSLRSLFKANGLQVVYEACSLHPNAGIYLLFVGSRQPERWKGLPVWQPLTQVGTWIGATPLWRRAIGRLRLKLLGHWRTRGMEDQSASE